MIPLLVTRGSPTSGLGRTGSHSGELEIFPYGCPSRRFGGDRLSTTSSHTENPECPRPSHKATRRPNITPAGPVRVLYLSPASYTGLGEITRKAECLYPQRRCFFFLNISHRCLVGSGGTGFLGTEGPAIFPKLVAGNLLETNPNVPGVFGRKGVLCDY